LTDPAFPRYPAIPVVVCSGFQRREDEDEDEDRLR
jgi:hypothetical protein